MDYRSGKKQRRERALRGQGSTGGFSMAETLATVAIIVILLALAVVGIFNLYYSLQQKELDSKAEIIYVAAQDQMTKIMAAGQKTLMDPGNGSGAVKISGVPGDAYSNDDLAVAAVTGNSSNDGSSHNVSSGSDKNYVEPDSLAYITSDNLRAASGNAASQVLFGNSSNTGLDDELLGHNWVIEYDPSTLAVYSVFYNQGNDEFVSEYESSIAGNEAATHDINRALRFYDDRLAALKAHEAAVGYHGGANATSTGVKDHLEPTVEVDNGEKLTATITCNKPKNVEPGGSPLFAVTLNDGSYGNSYKEYYTLNANYRPSSDIAVNRAMTGKNYTFSHKTGINEYYMLDLTLDSLEGDGSLRFASLYGHKHNIGVDNSVVGRQQLVEGANIHISVDVYWLNSDGSVASTVDYWNYGTDTNSLFGYEDGANNGGSDTHTALIACGRHLQNLDEGSGAKNSDVDAALQIADVDFSQSSDVDSQDWLATYGADSGYFNGVNNDGTPLFKPVINNKLASYSVRNSSGYSYQIVGLHAVTRSSSKGTDFAGLFGELGEDQGSGKGLKIANVSLVSPYVKCTNADVDSVSDFQHNAGTVGALVGRSSAPALTLSACRVYLGSNDIDAKAKAQAWLQGSTVGGLVGEVFDGEATIESSSSSTVLGGRAADAVVGGLVGKVLFGKLSVQSSYADSYLVGSVTGGLVGEAATAAACLVKNSYAAGFMAWGSNSGYAGGILAKGAAGVDISNSYSLMARLDAETAEREYASAGSISPVAPAGAVISNCYFLFANGVSSEGGQSGVIGMGDSDASREMLLESLANYDSSSAFTNAESGNSKPYKLMGQSLDSYMWPTLKNLRHYGDWSAGFEPGSLVYYEEYTKGATRSYGFEGGNVVKSTLKDVGLEDNNRLVVSGDGYGIVVDKTLSSGKAVVSVSDPSGSYKESQTIDFATSKSYSVDEYKVYPLDTDIVNMGKPGNRYYLQADIQYQEGDTGLSSDTSQFHYYFNPHFARTQVRTAASDDVPTLGENGEASISIRTARQLYDLSLYYSAYRDALPPKTTFAQGRNISYSEYRWQEFAGYDSISKQEPIGRSSQSDQFEETYDGGCFEITDVSFESNKNECVGLFGSIASAAVVKNVVLCTDYHPIKDNSTSDGNNYYVKYSGKLSGNITANLGVLAGYNAGRIMNCAASGYYVAGSKGTIYAYTNSTVNVGGLVGCNNGRISNSSADSPLLRLSGNYATVRAGGFVGYNLAHGKISNTYALGVVKLLAARGGSASISGFAGKNAGSVSNSYCATAIEVSGDNAMSYGFAPKGGSVKSNCHYLNNGTYIYAKNMHSYNFDTSVTSGRPKSYSELKSQGGQVELANSFYHGLTESESGYPYKGMVKASDGKTFVHYGDWQDDVKLGTLGVFYWEHEEYGSNNGYHMTYIGSEVAAKNGIATDEYVQNTSLCNEHDDGGVITSYGYGFYVENSLAEDANARINWKSIACSANGPISDIKTEQYNETASSNLSEQMGRLDSAGRKYSFYAFTTRTQQKASRSDYITLRTPDNAESDKQQNGELTIVLSEGTQYKFSLSPFFANAMSVENGDLKNQAAKNLLVASGKSGTDFSVTPGFKGNEYEVRSVDQLQYINWNGVAADTNRLVDGEGDKNWKQFNYLVYADDNKLGLNEPKSIEGIASESSKRAKLCWVQTHDVEESDANRNFTPIAGTYTSSGNANQNNTGYNAVVYSWFGSSYDGQSYTIKNINIRSNSFNVGIFGTTVGANIQNVIMYSDSLSNTIERVCGYDGYDDKLGAYAIGGLVGVAFDYLIDSNALKNSDNAIENCAISGYSIIDRSSNQMGLGEVNIGGLIGVANVNLRRCSANVSIRDEATFYKGVGLFGAFIRVGGLTGGAQGNVEDCYTGGSFEFDRNIAKTVNWKSISQSDRDFFVAVGGISGSAFTSNYKNLTGSSVVRDGSPTFANCYTYFTFPKNDIDKPTDGDETKLIMSAVASHADRARNKDAKTITVNNCYYYEPITGKVSDRSADVVAQYRHNDASKNIGEPTSVTYDQMRGCNKSGEIVTTRDEKTFLELLNGKRATWAPVTTSEGGNNIDGKYSFATLAALQGKNYPFPSVITQQDSDHGEVHVHYGDWPLDGLSYWKDVQADGEPIDIFADRQEDATGSLPELATRVFVLHVDADDSLNPGKTGREITTGDFSYDGSSIDAADVSNPDKRKEITAYIYDDPKRTASYSDGSVDYEVTIAALKEGTVVIGFGDSSSKDIASFTLKVTAELTLLAEPINKDTLYDANTNTLVVKQRSDEGDSSNNEALAISAKPADSKNAHDYALSDDMHWSTSYVDDEEGAQHYVTPFFPDDAAVEGGAKKNCLTVTRHDTGEEEVVVTANYLYNGNTYNASMFITVDDPSVIGLAYRNEAADTASMIYNETELARRVSDGRDKVYGHGEVIPSYMLDRKNNEVLYLYTSAGEALLPLSSLIKSVSINGESYGNGEYDSANPKKYFVSYAEDSAADKTYRYTPISITYNGNKPSGTIPIEITLTNGAKLSARLDASVINRTETVKLSFRSGNTTIKTENVARGCQYKFIDFGISDFDGWQRVDSGVVYDAGQSYRATGDANFTALFKRVLTLKVPGTSISKTFHVGRAGIDLEAQNEYKALCSDSVFKKYTLDGWYNSESLVKAVEVIDADGSCSLDTGADNFGVVNGKLTLKGDATLYAARAIWKSVDSFEDGHEYIILNKNVSKDNPDVAVVKTAMPDENNPDLVSGSKREHGLEHSEIVARKCGSGDYAVVDPVANEVIWKATRCDISEKRNGVDLTRYFYLKNEETGLNLVDSDIQYAGKWAVAGVTESERMTLSDATLSGYNYGSEPRLIFTIKGPNGLLGTFNDPRNGNYSVGFDTKYAKCLFIDNGKMGTVANYAYMYGKSIDFVWD